MCVVPAVPTDDIAWKLKEDDDETAAGRLDAIEVQVAPESVVFITTAFWP